MSKRRLLLNNNQYEDLDQSFADLRETDPSYVGKEFFIPQVTATYNSGLGEYENQKLELINPVGNVTVITTGMTLRPLNNSFTTINYSTSNYCKIVKVSIANIYTIEILFSTGAITVGSASGQVFLQGINVSLSPTDTIFIVEADPTSFINAPKYGKYTGSNAFSLYKDLPLTTSNQLLVSDLKVTTGTNNFFKVSGVGVFGI
jgi:hypothetical protein